MKVWEKIDVLHCEIEIKDLNSQELAYTIDALEEMLKTTYKLSKAKKGGSSYG